MRQAASSPETNGPHCACGADKYFYSRVCATCRRRDSHGHTKGKGGTYRTSPTYRTWMAMVQRCTNPNASKFPGYGGRGIQVCARWRVFSNFLADMGERPAGLTLDRKDNNGHYEVANCRWATPTEQRANQRRIR